VEAKAIAALSTALGDHFLRYIAMVDVNITRRSFFRSAISPLALAAGSPAQAWTHEHRLFVNIVKDYGAVGDGVTNNDAAFGNFRAWARNQSQPITLVIPPGNYFVHDRPGTLPFDSIKELIVLGYGATMPTIRLTGLGGFSQRAGFSARLKSVNNGDRVLHLKNPAEASKFSMKNWCSINALEWQGSSGYPPNHQYNEFVQIESIDHVVGTITLTAPVTQSYSSRYPETSSPGGYDTGGPASLMVMTGDVINGGTPASWDVDVQIFGLSIINTLGQPGEQVYGPGRSLRLTDMNFVGCAPIPTTNKLFYALRCTTDLIQVENDKECESVQFVQCQLRSMITQSSSIRELILDGTTIASFCTGTARNTIIRNGCVLRTLRCGVIGYGYSESVIARDSTIHSLDAQLSNDKTIDNFANSGGKLTYTGRGVLSWGPPGARCFIGGSSRINGVPFTISDVTSTVGQAPVLETNVADPTPTLPSFMGAPALLVEHPAPSVTFTNVDGCPAARDLSSAPAGLPLYSHIYRKGDFSSGLDAELWGTISGAGFIRVNVIRADSGSNPTAPLHLGGPFDNVPVLNPDLSAGLFGSSAIINAKVAGERLITVASVTGAQRGDILAVTGDIHFVEDFSPKLLSDLSGYTSDQKPIIELEVLTTQFTR
jgi:hypothetical protein